MLLTVVQRNYFNFGIILNILLISLGILLYPNILPAAMQTIIFCLIFLVLYAVVFFYINKLIKRKESVVKYGMQTGILIGCIFIFDINLEYFINLSQSISSLSTFVIMLSIFVLFGWNSARIVQKTKSIKRGILSSIIAAMLGVLIALICGFIVNFLFMHRLEQILLHDPEYKFSPVRDIRTFTFYNTLDSAFTHLLEAPVLAVIFGFVGGSIKRLLHNTGILRY